MGKVFHKTVSNRFFFANRFTYLDKMTRQGELFETEQRYRADLHRRKGKGEQFRAKVAAVLRAFRPIIQDREKAKQ